LLFHNPIRVVFLVLSPKKIQASFFFPLDPEYGYRLCFGPKESGGPFSSYEVGRAFFIVAPPRRLFLCQTAFLLCDEQRIFFSAASFLCARPFLTFAATPFLPNFLFRQSLTTVEDTPLPTVLRPCQPYLLLCPAAFPVVVPFFHGAVTLFFL